MTYLTYKDLVRRFGGSNAKDLLRTIEKLAQIQHEIITPIDQEQRLQRALQALNDNHYAA